VIYVVLLESKKVALGAAIEETIMAAGGGDQSGIGSIIESMPGIAVLLSAAGFKVLRHNKEAEKYLPAAMRTSGVVGAKHSDFIQMDEKVSLATLRRVSEGRERIESREYATTMWSGRRIWLDWSAMPIENGTDKADVLVMARDVTDRKLAEEALRVTLQDREFLEFSVVNSSQPFASGSLNGGVIYFNRAFEELTGYAKEELKKISWRRTLPQPNTVSSRRNSCAVLSRRTSR